MPRTYEWQRTFTSPPATGRLIDEIQGPEHPGICVRCADQLPVLDRERRRYVDLIKGREYRVLHLCESCEVHLMDRDTRFTEELVRLNDNEPFPGLAEVCIDCAHRRGLTCESRSLTSLGGNGLVMSGTSSTMVSLIIREAGR